MFLNKKHEGMRVSMGKNAKIIDHSMHAVGAIQSDQEQDPQKQQAENDNTLKDLTDLKNEDFVYVY